MAKSSFMSNPAKIKVIGLGGGGCNAITRMVQDNIQGVEFIAMNTDAQAMAITEAPIRIQLGEKCIENNQLEAARKIANKFYMYKDGYPQFVANLLDKYLEGREYDRSDFNTHSLYRDTLNGIAKLLADMRKRDEVLRQTQGGTQKIDRPQIFVDFLKDLVSYLKDHDPEALAGLEKNFDPFIQFAKGKYS